MTQNADCERVEYDLPDDVTAFLWDLATEMNHGSHCGSGSCVRVFQRWARDTANSLLAAHIESSGVS